MKLLEQFRQAVSYGSGRAFQILQKHPELPVDDILIDFALHNADYDPQCSGNRSLYMDELLELRPNYRKLLSQIAERFACDKALSAWDADQVYELLLGNSRPTAKVRRICYKRFAERHADESEFGFTAICDYDGQSGLLFVARTIGRTLLKNSEYLLDLWIPEHFDGAEYDYDWRIFLREHEAEPEVKAFLAHCENIQKEYQKEKDSDKKKNDFAFIQEMLQTGICRSFYRVYLTDEEWEILQKAFFSETDANKLLILCRALEHNHKLTPDMFEKLVKLSENPDRTLRSYALSALAELNIPEVHDYAVRKLSENPFAREYADLLASHWKKTDARFIYALFKKYKSRHIRHDIIMGLRASKKLDPEILLFLYRHCPCGSCREGLISALHDQKAISEEFSHELCHESQLDIREIAGKVVN